MAGSRPMQITQAGCHASHFSWCTNILCITMSTQYPGLCICNKWGRMRAKGHRSWGHDTNSTSVNQHKRLKPWNPMCVWCACVCVFVKRSRILVDYSLSGDSTSLACSERLVLPHSGDLVSGSKPLSCQEHPLISGLHLDWCERLVGISIHTKGRLIYIPLNSLVVSPWSRERLFRAAIFTELCRLTGLKRESVERPVDMLPVPVV